MHHIPLHKTISQCIYCKSEEIKSKGQTSLGYNEFRCADCKRKFNERTGSPFNHVEQPTDVVLLVVRWYLSYKLSLRDLSEMFLERGFEFSHESVRSWILRFTPLLITELRKKRHGKAGISWYVDETYIKVKGKWTSLYRAIDRDGGLVDTMLSKTRNMSAAKRFFASAIRVTGSKPKRVTTDKHPPYPRAIRTTIGKRIKHRTNQYLNNRTEQSHRPIKQRYYPMLGFGAFSSAAIICRGIDELRNFYRPRRVIGLTLSQKRCIRASKNYSLAKMILKY